MLKHGSFFFLLPTGVNVTFSPPCMLPGCKLQHKVKKQVTEKWQEKPQRLIRLAVCWRFAVWK